MAWQCACDKMAETHAESSSRAGAHAGLAQHHCTSARVRALYVCTITTLLAADAGLLQGVHGIGAAAHVRDSHLRACAVSSVLVHGAFKQWQQ